MPDLLDHNRNTGAATAAPVPSCDLRVANLSKAYGAAAPVFGGVEFALATGEAAALVGANGAGKSTLLRCVLGLIAPSAGDIHLLGCDVATARGTALRRLRAQTGLVAQKHNLVPRLSVLSNVLHGFLGSSSGPRFWRQSLAPAEARAAAMASLAKVGLADFAERRADRLSGGQSQRVAIARALVCAPRFLIADEPTASLDPAAGEEVMDLFFDLVKREGVTVLFTSHNVEHALRYGDRVLGLGKGRLEVDADAASLTSNDLRGLYG